MNEVGPAPAAMDPVLVFAAALGDRGPESFRGWMAVALW